MKTMNIFKKLFRIKPKEECLTIFPIGLLALAVVMFIGALPIWWTSIKGFLAHGSDEGIANYVIIRNMGLFFAGFLGIALAGWRAKSMDRQAFVAEQGHITDRIIKATENLGSQAMHVRVGAIYTLWRTAQDTNREMDKVAVLDILCAFIRKPTSDESTSLVEAIREDVQIAVSLVCGKSEQLNLDSEYFLDLSGANLRRADLTGGVLVGSKLNKTDFFEAILTDADLTGASMYEAQFQRAVLLGAKLNGAKALNTKFFKASLVGAELQRAMLLKADFTDAILAEVNLDNSNLISANLSGVEMGMASAQNAQMTEAKLENASLVGTNFTGATLIKADFKWAGLQATTLTSADLSYANLEETLLFDARMDGTDFRFANLTGTSINREQLENVHFSQEQIQSMDIKGS